jgi:hypothetical protein
MLRSDPAPEEDARLHRANHERKILEERNIMLKAKLSMLQKRAMEPLLQ